MNAIAELQRIIGAAPVLPKGEMTAEEDEHAVVHLFCDGRWTMAMSRGTYDTFMANQRVREATSASESPAPPLPPRRTMRRAFSTDPRKVS